MIPQTKIETEMRKINPCVGAEYTAYNHGFKQGVRFAESEMGQIFNEYGQWLASMWSDDHVQCHYNTDLFAKFMAERTNPAPDIEG